MNTLIRITVAISIIAIISTTTTYSQCEIARYGIVISEIMADPTPCIGLPAAEYIELYNRTSESQTLSGWKLKIGNSMKTLPSFTIDSASYILIIADKYRTDFGFIADKLVTLSSLSITDAGQTITLYDQTDKVIHHVAFRKEWHREGIKQDGGWSLEMIDENLPCAGRDNWDSSTGESGGTPGAPNTIRSQRDDHLPPDIDHVTLYDSATIRVFLTEPVHPEPSVLDNLFSIEPAIPITRVSEVGPDFQALDIHLETPLHSNTLYTLHLCAGLCDCHGNTATNAASINVGTPHAPEPGDIVINEILSHPISGSDADFIELFNKSSHIIDLKQVKIGSSGDTMPSKAVVAVSAGRQIFPNQYCVLCKNKDATLSQYYCPDKQALSVCDSLPAYANNQGVVFLTTLDLRRIDRVAYDESMHYSRLVTTEGVSLERVNPDESSDDPSNWHSAASTVGFATPGYRNSQASDGNHSQAVEISPEVFSPDNDGFDDSAEIRLSFAEGENRVSITILDKRGCIIKKLANNNLCGTEATFRWDGTNDNSRIQPPGIYLVVMECWNENGKRRRWQRVVSIR